MEQLTEQVMTLLGVSHIAYIRQIEQDGKSGFGVFAADGTQLAVFADRDTAYFTAIQHDLEPVSVH